MNNLMQGMGVTQLKRSPPDRFMVNGAIYALRKNAEDGSVVFDHARVAPSVRSKVQVSKDLWAYYVAGTMMPHPGTLEKPMDIVYIGFHNMDFDPMLMGPRDVMNMHVYVREGGNFGEAFVQGYLGIGQAPAGQAGASVEREPVRPYPVETDTTVMPEEEDGKSSTASKRPADAASPAD